MTHNTLTGTVTDNIAWRPAFTELRVDIANPTDTPYEDVDLLIRPTDPVAQIAQISQLPNVSFEDKDSEYDRLMHINNLTGIASIVPLALLATDSGYHGAVQSTGTYNTSTGSSIDRHTMESSTPA